MNQAAMASVDTADLISQLTLDAYARSGQSGSRSYTKRLCIFVGLGLCTALAAYAWLSGSVNSTNKTVVVKGEAIDSRHVQKGLAVAVSSSVVLQATGYVSVRRQAEISSRQSGLLVQFNKEGGDYVNAGEVLAQLDNTILSTQVSLARARVLSMQALSDELALVNNEAQLNWQRVETLATRQLVSVTARDKAQLGYRRASAQLVRGQRDTIVAQHELTLAEQRLAETIITAPFSGTIIETRMHRGEIISSAGFGRREVLCVLADLSTAEIEVDINESQINRIAQGQAVEAYFTAYPDSKIDAKVSGLIPSADRTRGTVRVRIALLEQDSRILPDMAVQVSFLHFDS